MLIGSAQWLTGPKTINTYTRFKKIFQANSGVAAIEVAADTEIELYLNGIFLPVCQLKDVAPFRSVTTISAELQVGENVLELCLYYAGRSSCCYGTGQNGFALALQSDGLTIFSDETWLCAPEKAYHSGLDMQVTSQLGFCFEYDAGEEVKFSDWRKATAKTEYKPVYRKRRISICNQIPQAEVALAQAGFLYRRKASGTFADICAGDFLCAQPYFRIFDVPPPGYAPAMREYRKIDCNHPCPLKFRSDFANGANGVYVIIDLGGETVGWLDFCINAPENCIIDIAHGEHLDDGRVRSKIMDRNFADRYICKSGKNHFTHRMRRLGARYLELHFTDSDIDRIEFFYARLIRLELPLPPESEFVSSDRMLDAERKMAVDTLKLCMHEHYEDCPWREQGLYAYDSKNQALFGYYGFGNYQFARRCFELLGENYFKEGLLKITSPGEAKRTIPIFSFAWLVECREYRLFSGDMEPILPKIAEKVLDEALKRRDEKTGLYFPPDGKHIWNFYEWSPGLNGEYDDAIHILYNLYLLEALKCYEGRYEKIIAETGRRIEALFWDEKTGVYRSRLGDAGELHEHTQVLMLYLGLVPRKKIDRVLDALEGNRLESITFSAFLYYLRALMELNPRARKLLCNRLKSLCEPLVYAGATSVWETSLGGDDFGYAGSLCHAWSAFSVYYTHAYVLGIQPMEPGFRKFRVKIYPGDLYMAEGTVPTPSGEIKVQWKLENSKLKISVFHPAELEMEYDEFPEFRIAEIKDYKI